MDLDSLMEARRESNDAAAAARAALEGHATYVMLEDLLRRRTGGELDAGSLDLGRLLGSVDLSSLGGTPALSGAPRLVRESLIFPYTGGLAFVQAWWREREGRPAPLGEQMPASTEQILHPERFAGADRDAPTGVRFPSGPAPPWREVHAGSLGEFEIRLLLSTFLADSVRARAAAAGWDGDRYRLLASPEGGEVLTWATVWDGPAEAAEFAAAVEAALRSRYGDSVRSPEDARAAGDGAAGRTVRVRRRRAGGRPLVVVTDAPADRRGELPRWATGVELEEAGGR